MGFSRYSIPFFIAHPRFRNGSDLLRKLVSNEFSKKFKELLQENFWRERLRELGLKK